MIHRGFKYKLAPTAEQEALLWQFSGVCRLIYNLAMEQRRDFWRHHLRQTGRQISFASQCRELTELRAAFDWIGAVSQSCQEQALRDLDKAYQQFFAGRGNYPRPRKRGLDEAFRIRGRETRIAQVNANWSKALVPKIGWIKFRDTRPIAGRLLNATISHDPFGWHISFACEIEHDAKPTSLPSVGIDRGVANTLALSNGELLPLPASLHLIDRRKRKAQRVLARRKRGSNRRKRALGRVARLSAKIARARRDWHHKAALSIARRFGDVAIEDLKIANMTASAKGTVESPGRNVRQKAGLNRSILHQGWFQFETILAYKLEERGGTLTKVSARYTSQTCSACGCIDRRSRESQARFACRHCGHESHADTNAATEIQRRNTSLLRMEGGQSKSPGEVRTGQRASLSKIPALALGGC